MSLYKKNKSNNFNQKFKKMPIIKSTLNISYFNNTNENIINSESRRLYINTENNIFKDDTNNNRRNELKKYNLKNYKNKLVKEGNLIYLLMKSKMKSILLQHFLIH